MLLAHAGWCLISIACLVYRAIAAVVRCCLTNIYVHSTFFRRRSKAVRLYRIQQIRQPDRVSITKTKQAWHWIRNSLNDSNLIKGWKQGLLTKRRVGRGSGNDTCSESLRLFNKAPWSQVDWLVRSDYTWEWSSWRDNGFTLCHSTDLCSACHRSWLFCRLSQNSGVVSKARANRSAMSGVIAPFSLMIFDTVFLDTPRVVDNSVIVIDSGFR